MIRFLFRLFDTSQKLLIHDEFKRIDPVTKILAFRQNVLRVLSVKEYAGFAKGII